jgi:hypothetical protein
VTKIKDVLRHCAFDPNKPGPMTVIADVGDPRYYQQRAMELIQLQAHRAQNKAAIPSLKQAIGLLALAVVELELKEAKPTAPQFPQSA